MKNILIRKATADDNGKVKEMCLRDNPEDFLPGIWPVWMSGKNSVNLVAEMEGRITGCVFGEMLSGADAWSQGLRVGKAFRRNGIGTMLMTALEKELPGMGAQAMFANVGAFNRACLATIFGLNWETAVHFHRRRIHPDTDRGFPSPPREFSREKISGLIQQYPVPASCQKTAYFKRAYFHMGQDYMARAIEQKAIRISPDADAYAVTDVDTDPLRKIWIVAMGGTAGGIGWLVESFMGEAGRSGAELVVDSPDQPEIQQILDELNFDPAGKEGNYRVVKKMLQGPSRNHGINAG